MPLTLVKDHLNRYPLPGWMDQQVYLSPSANHLMLRSHVEAKGLMQFRLGGV